MTTRDQLIQDVIANPEENAPREAFAAWGIAHDDPQGQLAHLQLAEARERRNGARSDAARLGAAAYDLIVKHRHVWAQDVLKIASEPQFYRGFVEEVVVDTSVFLTRAEELYKLAPIRAVQLLDAGSHAEALAASPYLDRLVSIEIYNRSQVAPLRDSGLRKLLASPHLHRLTFLSLPFNEITFEGVEVIASSSVAHQLRYVMLGQNPVDRVTETYGEDSMIGEIDHDSISLPPLGRQIKEKYGELPWLRAPSLFPIYPPDLHDV